MRKTRTNQSIYCKYHAVSQKSVRFSEKMNRFWIYKNPHGFFIFHSVQQFFSLYLIECPGSMPTVSRQFIRGIIILLKMKKKYDVPYLEFYNKKSHFESHPTLTHIIILTRNAHPTQNLLCLDLRYPIVQKKNLNY